MFSTDAEPGSAPPLDPRPEKRSPGVVRAAALIVAPRAGRTARDGDPRLVGVLGDLALLPLGIVPLRRCLSRARRARVCTRETAAALGVTRLARQAAVSQGPKRESRAGVCGTRSRTGGRRPKELGVAYGLDVTKVMFSSGHGVEKRRMGAMAAAGETVVDLFAGIGYCTRCSCARHAGVARVIACEWNPHSVEALRRNLERNGFGRDRCEVREGDNRRVAPEGVADRVLLGLLPDSERAWPTAVAALRDSGASCTCTASPPARFTRVGAEAGRGNRDASRRARPRVVRARRARRARQVVRAENQAPRRRRAVRPRALTSAWAHAVGASTSTSPAGRRPANRNF